MAIDEDYELIPRHELDALKKEIEKLKRNPLGDVPEGESILESINNMNETMKKLIELFTNTETDLAKEYAETNPVEELRNVKEQNEQIAQGILALADMIKEVKEDVARHDDAMKKNQGGMGGNPFDMGGMPPMSGGNMPGGNDPFAMPMDNQPPQGMPPMNDEMPSMPDFNQPMGLPPNQGPAPPQGMGQVPPKKKGFFR